MVKRDDVRLRDRLPFADRERRIVVGELRELLRHECFARNAAKRLEHGGRDSATSELLDHLSPALCEVVHPGSGQQPPSHRCRRGLAVRRRDERCTAFAVAQSMRQIQMSSYRHRSPRRVTCARLPCNRSAASLGASQPPFRGRGTGFARLAGHERPRSHRSSPGVEPVTRRRRQRVRRGVDQR